MVYIMLDLVDNRMRIMYFYTKLNPSYSIYNVFNPIPTHRYYMYVYLATRDSTNSTELQLDRLRAPLRASTNSLCSLIISSTLVAQRQHSNPVTYAT